MRFLADESCDFAVVRALRKAGHEVSAISEISPAAQDSAVLQLARSETRILLTEDKDFGLLAYAAGQKSTLRAPRSVCGLILPQFVLHYFSALHHKLHSLKPTDVFERVA